MGTEPQGPGHPGDFADALGQVGAVNAGGVIAERTLAGCAAVAAIIDDFRLRILHGLGTRSPTLQKLAAAVGAEFGAALHIRIELIQSKNNYSHYLFQWGTKLLRNDDPKISFPRAVQRFANV